MVGSEALEKLMLSPWTNDRRSYYRRLFYCGQEEMKCTFKEILAAHLTLE